MTTQNNEFRVMTSGAFTAAYKALIPQLESITGKTIVTVTTSIGTGDISIPNRLKRGEVADIVIVADGVLRQFIADGYVLADGAAIVARSGIGMAVRAGAPKPDISTLDALRKTLLQATSVGYSASESGKYLTTDLVQRLGIAEQVLPKSRLVGGGERVGAQRAAFHRGVGAHVGRAHATRRGPVDGFLAGDAVGPERVIKQREGGDDGAQWAVAGPLGKRILRREHAVSATERNQAIVVSSAALL